MTTANTTTETRTIWDFTAPLELSKKLNLSPVAPDAAPPPPLTDDNDSTSDSDETFEFDDDIFTAPAVKKKAALGKISDQLPVALGDFGEVWKFLGVPSPPSDSATPSGQEVHDNVPTTQDYASDGSAGRRTRNNDYKAYKASKAPKVPRSSDGSSDEAGEPPAFSSLTKTQRKRERRKARRALEQSHNKKNVATMSESEAGRGAKKSSERAASSHQGPSIGQQINPGLGFRITVGDAPPMEEVNAQLLAMGTPESVDQAIRSVHSAIAKAGQQNAPYTPSPKPRTQAPHQKANPAGNSTWELLMGSATLPVNGQGGQASKQSASKAPTLFPSSINPMRNGKAVSNQQAPWTSQTPGPMPMPNAMPATPAVHANTPMNGQMPKPQPVIMPQIVRSGEDRHWTLLTKIIQNFPEDRKYLVNPMNLTTHNNARNGIHVFVDASNIFIGFKDYLKHSRGIHHMQQTPDVDLSFDALALIMERRRPVAKRELAGSTPRVSAFDTAEAVGYNTHILEKVYKARQLTERQIWFQEAERLMGRRPRYRSSKVAPPCNTVNLSAKVNDSEGGSGSETNTPQYSRPAFVEQGVDEILHLKMAHSIIDQKEPSTMVVATGDAATAEYSDGFMRMIQRALQGGWKVELVSWSTGINGMYNRQEWHQTWGDQFKIIYLDQYAEELLNMDWEGTNDFDDE